MPACFDASYLRVKPKTRLPTSPYRHQLLAANTTTLSFRLAGILFLLIKLGQPIEMSALSFSFSLEATAKVHDALICLAKFGETVCMEARGDIVNFHKCMICLLGFANV